MPPPLYDPTLEAPAVGVADAALPVPVPPPTPAAATRARQTQQQARATQVCTLHQQGWTLSAIARHLGLNRKTVRDYVNAGTDSCRARRPSPLDPYKPYLLERWNAGCRTGTQLFQELRQRGYRGQRSIVLDYITRLRKAQGLPPRTRLYRAVSAVVDPEVVPLTPRQAAWQVLRRPDLPDEPAQTCVRRLRQAHADLDAGVELAQAFAHLLRTRQGAELDAWLERAATSTLEAFQRFAAGITPP